VLYGLVGRQEGHLVHKKHLPLPLIPKGSIPEQKISVKAEVEVCIFLYF